MKKHYMLWLTLLLLWTPLPIHASTQRILIRSKDMPLMFLIDVTSDSSLHVTSIPSDMYLANDSGTLLSVQKENIATSLQRMEQAYDISISSYVEVDISQIDEDFHLDHSKYDLSFMDGITSYFEQVKNELDISDILHYQRYISSDLNLNDYYTYYRMFQDKVVITYDYASYFTIQQKHYPMDVLPNMK